MLNFGTNFLFYTICSKTSRNELYLIMYYYGYWKWSTNYKKFPICNHPNHNKHISVHERTRDTSTMHRVTQDSEHKSNAININNSKNSKLKIHCFLLNAKRLRILCEYEAAKCMEEKSAAKLTNHAQDNFITVPTTTTTNLTVTHSKSIELNNLIESNNNDSLLEKQS